MPVGGDVEQVLYVGADIHRATRLAKGQDTGSYTPVVGDAVLSGRTDTEDGSVGTRIRVYPDFGANSPVALYCAETVVTAKSTTITVRKIFFMSVALI